MFNLYRRQWLSRTILLVLFMSFMVVGFPALSQKPDRPVTPVATAVPSEPEATKRPQLVPTEIPATEIPPVEPPAATPEPTEETETPVEIILTVAPTPEAEDDHELPQYLQTFCLMQITNAGDDNPFTFGFEAAEANNIASFQWNFNASPGPAANQSGPGPHTHTYSTTGTFTVQLTCTPLAGFGSVIVLTGSITVAPVAVANFELTAPGIVASGLGGYSITDLAPVTITTINQSSDDNATYSWDVDGPGLPNLCTGTTTNITCGLPVYGIYNFSLNVTIDSGGPLSVSAGMTKQVTLNAPPPLFDFTYSPVAGEGPLTVTFEPEDLGGGPATLVEFDFDFVNPTFDQDRVVSAPYNPFTEVFPAVVSPATERTYNVRMRYTGPGGTGFIQKQVVISASSENVVSGYTYELTGNNTGGQIEVCFTNISTGPFEEVEWDFDGNGTYEVNNTSSPSSLISPYCRFYPGSLNNVFVFMRVSTIIGTNALDVLSTTSQNVILTAAPLADFSINPSANISVNQNYSLNGNLSTGDIDTYEWDLDGDGDYDDFTGINPSGLSFSSPGPRTLRLRVTGPGGVATAEKIITVTYGTAVCAITGSFEVVPGSGNPTYSFTTGTMQGRTVTVQSWRAVPASGPQQTLTVNNGNPNAFTLNIGSGTTPYNISLDLTLSDGSVCTAYTTVNVFYPPIDCTVSPAASIPSPLYPVPFSTTFNGGVTGTGSGPRAIAAQTTTLFRGNNAPATNVVTSNGGSSVGFTNDISTAQTFPINWRVRYEVTLNDGTTCFDEVAFQTVAYPLPVCAVTSTSSAPTTNAGNNSGQSTYTTNVTDPAGRPISNYVWTASAVSPGNYTLISPQGNSTMIVEWHAPASPVYSYAASVDSTVTITNADGTTVNIDCSQRNVTANTRRLDCPAITGDPTPVLGETNAYGALPGNTIGRTIVPPGIVWTLTRTDGDPDVVVDSGVGDTFNYTFNIPDATYVLNYSVAYGSDADPSSVNFPYDECNRSLDITTFGVTENFNCDAFPNSGSGFNEFSPNNAATSYSYRVDMDNGNDLNLHYRYVLVGPGGIETELGTFDSTLDGFVPFGGAALIAFPFMTLRPQGVGTYTMRVEVSPAVGETGSTHTCSLSRDLTVGAMNVTYSYTIAGPGSWTNTALPIDTDICITNMSTATGDAAPPPAADSLLYDWTITGPASANSLNAISFPQDTTELPCISFNAAGTYVIRLNGASSTNLAFGMEDFHQVSFTVYGLQSISLTRTDGNVFAGNDTSWLAQGENINPGTYYWTLTRPNSTTTNYGPGGPSRTTDSLNEPGLYTMQVRGTGPLGNTFASAQFTLLAADSLRASFTRTPGSGLAPLNVCFTDTSITGSSPINLWEWDFNNDGIVDATFNSPQAPGSICYTYATPGTTYIAQLRVYNATFDDQATNRIRVLSLNDLTGNFSISYTGAGQYCFTPVNMSTTPPPGALATAWDYGDDSPINNLGTPNNGTVCHNYAFNTDPQCFFTVIMYFEAPDGSPAEISKDIPCVEPAGAPALSMSGVCSVNRTATFTVSNSGQAMSIADEITIRDAGNNVVFVGPVQLAAGGSQNFSVSNQVGNVTAALTNSPAVTANTICVEYTFSAVCDAVSHLPVFTVSKNPAASPDASQTYTITDSIGTVIQTNSWSLPSGVGSIQISVPLGNNPYETYTFTSNGALGNYTASSGPCAPQPDLSVVGVCRTNGNSGEAEVVFTVTNTGGPMVVAQNYTVTPGTTPAGTFQLPTGGSIDIVVASADNPYVAYTLTSDSFAGDVTLTHSCTQPDLSVVGICRTNALNGEAEVVFSVTNNGGNMLEPQNWTITGGTAPVNGSLQLASGATGEAIVNVSDDPYATYTFTSSGFADDVTVNHACTIPALTAVGICRTNAVSGEAEVGFTVTNNSSDMLEAQPYVINDSTPAPVASGNLFLASGASIEVLVPSADDPYDTYTFVTTGFAGAVNQPHNCANPAIVAVGVCAIPRTFNVTNNGGEMLEAQPYTIVRDGVDVVTGTLDLDAGGTTTVSPPNGSDPYGTYSFVTTGFATDLTVDHTCPYPVMSSTNVCSYALVITVTNTGGPTLQEEPWEVTDPSGVVVASGSNDWSVQPTLDITLTGLDPYLVYVFTTTGFTDTYDADNFNLCQSPALEVTYICNATPGFTITNTGGDMLTPQQVQVLANSDVLIDEPLQLLAGGVQGYSLDGSNPYEPYTLTTSGGFAAELTIPGDCGTPSLVVEGVCGRPAGFTVTNTGSALVAAHSFDILSSSDQSVVYSGSFTVAAGQTTAIVLPDSVDASEGVIFTTDDFGVAAEAMLTCTGEARTTGEFTGLGEPQATGISFPTCGRGCPVFKLYHTDEVGGWEIFRLDGADEATQTSQRTNLSLGLAEDISSTAPSLSPDNEWIVFSSDRDGNWELYVAPTSGGGPESVERVTYNDIAIDSDPVWGPGNYVVFETTRHGTWDLYAIDMQTGNEFRLTDSVGNDTNPYWSEDGSTIVFQSDRPDENGDRKWQVYELNVGTLATARLSDGSTIDVDPQYSHGSGKIAFRSYGAQGDNSQLSLMNADGSGRMVFSDVAGDATNASWSPNDTYIAYQSDLDGDLDIYVYEIATGLTRHLTDNAVADYAPTWLCDDIRVVWTSDIMGDPNIFEVNVPPISGDPILVDPDADQMTFEASIDIYPISNPSEENASREGKTLLGNFGQQTLFLDPLVSLTPVDLSFDGIIRTEWQPINVCTPNALLGGG